MNVSVLANVFCRQFKKNQQFQAQVLFFDIFPEKDPHLNVVEVSGDIHISLFGISVPSSICQCNSLGVFFEILVILSAILLPIKSPVVSVVFWITLYEAVFIASVVEFLAVSRMFLNILIAHVFSKR